MKTCKCAVMKNGKKSVFGMNTEGCHVYYFDSLGLPDCWWPEMVCQAWVDDAQFMDAPSEVYPEYTSRIWDWPDSEISLEEAREILGGCEIAAELAEENPETVEMIVRLSGLPGPISAVATSGGDDIHDADGFPVSLFFEAPGEDTEPVEKAFLDALKKAGYTGSLERR